MKQGTSKDRCGAARRPQGRAGAWARFHGDERGGMLEYAMVFAFVAIPMMIPFWIVDGERISIAGMLFKVLSDYFAMIAYYVTWPFL